VAGLAITMAWFPAPSPERAMTAERLDAVPGVHIMGHTFVMSLALFPAVLVVVTVLAQTLAFP
jgi:hypothetical protein